MPITAKHLASTLLTSSQTAIYSVPASTKARITHVIFSNGSTAGTVSLRHFDSSASTGAFLLNNKAIAANSNVEVFDLILEEGDSLQAFATTTAEAYISIYGIEES